MATQISVPGGSSHGPLIFSVTGTSTTNYAVAFQNAVDTASNSGKLTLNILSAGTSSGTGPVVLNDILAGSNPTSTYSLSTGGQYTLVDLASAVTVVGSAAGADTVLAGGNSTYDAVGGANQVTFFAGSNVYNGSTVAGATGDTITGGQGHDTINTGVGSSTVFSGAGTTLIYLNDTTGGDVAYLGDGTAYVVSSGTADTVATGAAGQTVFGGTNGNLFVDIERAGFSGPGNNLIVADTASGSSSYTVSVFDSVGGNNIYGGSGTLLFIGESTASGIADTVVAGSGATTMFGAAGSNITFFSTDTSGGANFIAGAGNETLNGANAGSFAFWGDTDTSASASVVTSVTGGTGSEYFSTGAGTETFNAGSGADVFGLNTLVGGSGAHITINNFSAADSVSFVNESQSQVAAAINSETVSGGNLTIKLADNTTVTFTGITSLSGHIV